MYPAFGDEDVTRLRSALARIARGLGRLTVDEELTRTQLSVLGTVARDGSVGLGELATREGVNPSMLSRVVARLEERGLISRTTDPVDRRVVRVAATPDGDRLQRRSRMRRTRLLTERLAGMPGQRVVELLAALPALEALADQLGPRPATGGAARPRLAAPNTDAESASGSDSPR